MNLNLKSMKNLISIAKNKNLESFSKAFAIICEKSSDWKNRSMDYDDLFEALVTNNNLNWSNVANGINIEAYVKLILSEHPWISNQRQELVIDFCKNEKCPQKIKGVLYKKTGDFSFLSPEAVSFFLDF